MLEVPNLATTAMAASVKIVTEVTRTDIMAIFTSKASTFLPRYSGVLPTISPAMNTAKMTKTNIP